MKTNLINPNGASARVTIRPSKKAGTGFTLTIDGQYIQTFSTRLNAKSFLKNLAEKRNDMKKISVQSKHGAK